MLLVCTWWRHQLETFFASLALCAGNSPVISEFPAQRPVTWSFDVFFDMCLNKRLIKQSWGWWFDTLSRPLWRHCNESRPMLISYTLSHEYRVVSNRYSRLLFTSEDRLCANLCVHNWRIWRHNACSPRSHDVTDQLWWRYNAKSDREAICQ